MYRLIPGLLALAAGVIASDPCNGFVEYCDRKYSDITFLGAHDSEFVGKLPQHDQHDYPETDMDRGFRYFTTQVHLDKGEIRQCHTECFLLNVGPFSDIVNSLKGWLDAHPREVVTLLVTNHDIDVEMFKAAFEANGADKMAFVPDHTLALGEWPTLGQMIDSGKRLVVFMDYGADTSKVNYILPQYDYYVETPFSPTDDNFFNCDIQRPDNGNADTHMVFANHNLNIDIAGILISAPGQAEDTNSVANIKKQTDICVSKYGKNPNVVLVDFITEGQAADAQRQLNGL